MKRFHDTIYDSCENKKQMFDTFWHKIHYDDVMEELIRCTQSIPATCYTSIFKDDEEIFWSLTSEQLLWCDTIDDINNILA